MVVDVFSTCEECSRRSIIELDVEEVSVHCSGASWVTSHKGKVVRISQMDDTILVSSLQTRFTSFDGSGHFLLHVVKAEINKVPRSVDFINIEFDVDIHTRLVVGRVCRESHDYCLGCSKRSEESSKSSVTE